MIVANLKTFLKKKITIVYVWRKKNSLVHSWAPCKNFLEFFTEKKEIKNAQINEIYEIAKTYQSSSEFSP